MSTPFRLVQTPAVALYSGISATATSLTVTPYPKDLDGTKLTMADFGTIGRMTVDPKVTSYEEIISFTGMTDNGDGTCTFTGLTRDLISKSPYTTPGTGKIHGASAVVVFSDNPQAYFEFGALRNDNSWLGLNDFAVSPTVPTASSPLQAINFAQLTAAMASGGVDMSTTVKGIGRTATSPNKTIGTFTVTIASPAIFTANSHGLTADDTVQFTTTGALPTGIAASTTYYIISTGLTANTFEIAASLGGTAINTSGSQSGTHTLIRTTPYVVNDQDTRLPTQGENDALVGNNIDQPVGTGNKMMTQTGLQHGAEKYVLAASASSTAYTATLVPAPTSYTSGMEVLVKIDVANTTSTPTLNVNGLGAKTIVKGTSIALNPSDLIIGQVARFVYDGTNLVLQNPSIPDTGFLTSGAPGTTTTNTTAAVLTYSLPGGVLSTNKGVRIRANLKVATNGTASQTGSFTIAYGGTTIALISQVSDGTPRTQTTSFIVDILLMGSGATNTQHSSTLVSTDTAASAGITFSNTVVATSAIDSTAAQNITISSSTTNANVTNTFVDYMIQKIV